MRMKIILEKEKMNELAKQTYQELIDFQEHLSQIDEMLKRHKSMTYEERVEDIKRIKGENE